MLICVVGPTFGQIFFKLIELLSRTSPRFANHGTKNAILNFPLLPGERSVFSAANTTTECLDDIDMFLAIVIFVMTDVEGDGRICDHLAYEP